MVVGHAHDVSTYRIGYSDSTLDWRFLFVFFEVVSDGVEHRIMIRAGIGGHITRCGPRSRLPREGKRSLNPVLAVKR